MSLGLSLYFRVSNLPSFVPALLLKLQLMSSWRRRCAFAKPATPKTRIYDVTEGVTLVLDCHDGPMRQIYVPKGYILTGPTCF